jgi:hypothetical protein
MSWFKKFVSMKTVKRILPDVLPNLVEALPHASDPELDLLLQLLKSEIQRRIATTHTSTVDPAKVSWQPPKET